MAGTILFYICVAGGVYYLLGKSSVKDAAVVETCDIKYDLLLSTVLYIVFTITVFYPVLKSVSTALIGYKEDPYMHLWDMWWTLKAIGSGKYNLTYTNYLYYPEGTSLTFHAFSFYNLFLAVLLKPFLNLVTTYNLLILSTFVLSGMGMFLLVKYLTGNSILSFIAGYIFAFNPSHFSHSLQQIEVASIQFIPFFVLYFIRLIKEGDKKYLILSIISFLSVMSTGWYNMMFVLYFIFGTYVYLAIKKRTLLLKREMSYTLMVIGVPILIFMPWIYKMLGEMLHRGAELVPGGHNHSVTNICALFVPYLYQGMGKIDIFHDIYVKCSGSPWEKSVYMGIANIIIVIAAFKYTIHKNAKYFLGFLFFLLLSMGTNLHFLDHITNIKLPYEILKNIPFFRNVRCPSRIIVFAYMFWGIIVANSVGCLVSKIRNLNMRKIVLLVLSMIIILDFFVVCDMSAKVYMPDCYKYIIEQHEDDFGIIDLPSNYIENEAYMMYQTQHNIPIAGGAIVRKSGVTMIDNLPSDFNVFRDELKKNKIKYIIVHANKYFKFREGNFSDPEQFKKWKNITIVRVSDFIRNLSVVFQLVYSDNSSFVFKVY